MIFLKSIQFRKILILWIIFTVLLIVIPYCFIYHQYSFNTFIRSFLNEEKYVDSISKICELAPWILVVLMGYILTLVNTIIYLITIYLEEGKKTRWEKTVICLIILVFIFFVALAFDIGSSFVQVKELLNDSTLYTKPQWSGPITEDRILLNNLIYIFSKIIGKAEIFTMAIFLIFGIADFILFYVKRKILFKKEYNYLNKEEKNVYWNKQFILGQLLLIDLPVLGGVFLIYCFSHGIIKVDILNLDSLYTFTAGAIGMHVIYSQIIFLILSTAYYFNEFKLKV